jgi:hypothetical protein
MYGNIFTSGITLEMMDDHIATRKKNTAQAKVELE